MLRPELTDTILNFDKADLESTASAATAATATATDGAKLPAAIILLNSAWQKAINAVSGQ